MAQTAKETTSVRQFSVAVCGNPNCGKTTIFNAITGLHQKVANYPGVTVEKISGQFRLSSHPDKTFTLVDIPGTYSLSAFSPDEYIATQALSGRIKGEKQPDIVICLIDATNLERGLYLLFQVLQIGRPVVVGLNMIDLVEKRGLRIDYEKLSGALGGIPVIPLVGSKGRGIEDLKQEIAHLVDNPYQSSPTVNHQLLEQSIAELMASADNGHRTRAEYIRILLDVNGPAEREFLRTNGKAMRPVLEEYRRRLVDHFGSLTAAETMNYTQRATEVYGEVVGKSGAEARSFSKKVDRFMLHPVFGPIFLVILMTLMFQSIFSWAQPLMDGIDMVFSALANLVRSNMAAGPLQSLLADGVIGGVGSVLVFLPQIMILFIYIALLEDSGYMPRAAFIVDRAFKWCGLSGKSFIPMLSSFACAVPGIMATRTIEDRKLRFLTIMVAPLMTCSARLPVYTIMIAAFIPHRTYLGVFNSQGLVLTSLYLLGIITAVFVSYVLKKTMFKTERGSFIMEMPSYKLPTLRSLFIRVFNRGRQFVTRAGTIILAITIIIWALSYYPRSTEVAAQYQTRRNEVAGRLETQLNGVNADIATLLATSPQYNSEMVTAINARLDKVSSAGELSTAISEITTANPGQADLVKLLAQRRRFELAAEGSLAQLNAREAGDNLRHSYFARMGRAIQPVFRPLGWDWKITMAVISSFPAREVIIATLGTTFNLGGEVDEKSATLVEKMQQAKWDGGDRAGLALFNPAVALSIMVFFALCCQCGATVVTIRQETAGWIYAAFVFGYMTVLAYVGALVTYQIASWAGLG